MTIRRFAPGVAALAALVMASSPGAQTTAAGADAGAWPAKALRLVVPFPPGGVADRLARLLSAKLQDSFGQSVVVENRPGAAGNIAAEYVAKSPGDGYTLLMGTHSTHGANPALYRNLHYDAVKDFAPVSLLVTVPNVLLIHPKVPANNLQELIALAKAQPGKLTFSSAGSGTSGHMAGQLLMSLAGIDLLHVPGKGPAQALQDVAGGHIDIVFDSVAQGMPLARDGRLKALAVTSLERSPIAPELPTLSEAGLPGYEIELWFAVFVPAGTPPAVIARLHAEIVRVLRQPDTAQSLVNQGMRVKAGTPAELAEHVKREIPKWGRLVRETGARVD